MRIAVNPTHTTCIPCPYSTQGHVPSMFVLYIKVYVIDKTRCEYEPNQTADYAVNMGFITSKIHVNDGCFNIKAYTEQQQTTGPVDNGCH